DIPWHRVLFIEADGERIWDRTTGVDRLGTSRAGRVRAPRRLVAPFFTARVPHAWRSGAWVPATAPPDAPATGTLRVLTWNTLWDRYDADRIHTARRRPLLISELERAGADVIALQEVERDLLDLLLATEWVRRDYTVCTDPAGRDVDDSGVLLLSRVPVLEAGRHVLGPFKQITAITVAGPVVVAALHLTSDHATDGPGRRAAELGELAAGLAGLDVAVVVAGDVNDGSGTPATRLGLRDAWTEVHGPGDRTATFDPVRNPLAAIGSLTGRVSRLDRVLLRGGDLTAREAVLCGDVPTEGLFASDHYGVAVDLTVGDDRGDTVDARPTARTAVAWLPPERLWPPVQELRRVLDPQFERWPPHVNILFGFLPEADFEDAAAHLTGAAAEVSPFEATIAGVRSFTHRDDNTVWVDPAAGGGAPWAGLHRALQRRFPQCRGRAEGWTPHLTLGRGGGPVEVRLLPAQARVDRLTLLSRRADEPMRPRAELLLGTGELRWLPDPPAPAPAEVDTSGVLDELRAAVPEGAVFPAGSRRLGCALPGADLDLVAAVPGTVDLPGRLAGAGWTVRPVIGARVPGLRLSRAGLDVDLVTVDPGHLLPGVAVHRRDELGEAAAVALSAVSDADAVLAATAGVPGFTGLARSVKAWARARGLDSAPFGGLPGIAWVVLAARTALEARDLHDDGLLRHFFGTWAAWDWSEPVTLDGVATVPPAAYPIRILTPSFPVRSCTEQVPAGMRDLLVQELYESWEGQPATPPHRRHRAWAVVTVQPVPGEVFAATIGRFRGRVRALLTDLEQAGVADAQAWPRPFRTGPDRREYAVGLGRRPPDPAVLSGWLGGLPGVRADLVDGGAVPTLY
ncbi:MAG TPA: poly(A) polymerase, partial [Actinoplanes sp.]|nr:poly(A) polymerase [Actinoplanes sp.]